MIAGNKDGSVDALWNGELGTLIDPESSVVLIDAVIEILYNPGAFVPDEEKLQEHFSYKWYKGS